jgi:hypothetical protein
MALVDDCVHYYNFDEASGNLIDQAGSADGTNDGCEYGGTGIIEDAWDFVAANTDSVDFSAEDFPATRSISIWINPDVVNVAGDGQVIFYHGSADTTASEYITLKNDEVHYVFGAQSGSNNIWDTDAANISAGEWTHIVVKGTGVGADGNYSIWVNGNEEAHTFDSNSANRARPTGSQEWQFGDDVGVAITSFDGLLDECALFDAEISDEDVGNLYNDGAGWAYPFASAGTNIQEQVGDSWKSVAGVQIQIGGSWKSVASIQENVGDAWKSVF